ncbi:unnamed protein product, partial [Hapterophycus canaliculatus]
TPNHLQEQNARRARSLLHATVPGTSAGGTVLVEGERRLMKSDSRNSCGSDVWSRGSGGGLVVGSECQRTPSCKKARQVLAAKAGVEKNATRIFLRNPRATSKWHSVARKR